MCGIAGIVSNKKVADLEQRIGYAVESVQHRGPECNQHWIDDDATVALGHCRLSIIDLSDRSRQPFHYDERYTISYNGEIYNYPEIRSELVSSGYVFTTSSWLKKGSRTSTACAMLFRSARRSNSSNPLEVVL